MKKILLAICTIIFSLFITAPLSSVYAITRVRGYFKRSTYKYVAPHYRTSPNKFKIDNYSTKGNYNPFTGKKGYKSLY